MIFLRRKKLKINSGSRQALFTFPSQLSCSAWRAEFYICTHMKQRISSFLLWAILFAVMAGLSSCANIIPPGGGPRDSLPPRLVASFPKDSSVNVPRTARTITLTFDEYVTLQSPQQAVIISPNPSSSRLPQFDSKLRNVTIRLKDTLEPNTTYSVNLGDAVRDVNEGNIARNLVYAFSTGPSISYNTYSGKVLDAESGKTDSTLIVILHKNLDDTAVLRTSPRYYARINGKGDFSFHNLPQGDFAVYVVPNNYQKRYNDSTQLFAFRNTPVTIGPATAKDTLYAFQEVKPAAKPAGSSAIKAGSPKDDKRLRYTTDLENGQQDLLSVLTLTFTHKLTSFDSSKLSLCDTNYQKISGYNVSLDTSRTKLSIGYNWKEKQTFRLLLEKEMAADSLGTQLSKKDTVRFITKSESDYGSIRLRFPNIDLGLNPVLQFVQNNVLLESVPLTKNDFLRKRFRPGTYELRILYDTNKNGVWDTGSFLHGNKRQPEIVFLIPKQLAVRANWDNEVDITL